MSRAESARRDDDHRVRMRLHVKRDKLQRNVKLRCLGLRIRLPTYVWCHLRLDSYATSDAKKTGRIPRLPK
jgi:hypothetical protein